MTNEIKIKKRNVYITLVLVVILLTILMPKPLITNSNLPEINPAEYSNQLGEKKSYSLEIDEGQYEFTPSIKTNAMAYNEQMPGPLIQGNVGEIISINVKNNLLADTTVHWHGLQVENIQDGVPQVVQDPIQPGESFTYKLELRNPGFYWYHSHVDTHKQVESGLQGPLLINEPGESPGNILVLDDVLINKQDNQLYDFNVGRMHGRFGNELLVNGQQNPEIYLSNSPARLRIVNTANARSFNLYFQGKPIKVIGKDIGKKKPYETTSITIHPGERYDLILESEESTTLSYLTSQGSTPLVQLIPENTKPLNVQTLQEFIPPFNIQQALEKEPDHYMSLKGISVYNKGLVWSINEKYFPETTEVFESNEGDLAKIRIKNTQGQPHPMHLHGQKFIVLSRNSQLNPNIGWEDTTMINSNEEVDIVFIAEEKGEWVFHCHILEHAEAGMLSILKVE